MSKVAARVEMDCQLIQVVIRDDGDLTVEARVNTAIMSINGLSVPLHQVHISRKKGVVSFRAEARRGTIIENAERES